MRYLMWTALAAGLWCASNSASQASDTIRLGGPSAEAGVVGATDTELVRWGRGFGGYGRGYGGGYGRGYYGGGYGRSYYGGYYARSYYGRGYYGGGYGGGYYGLPYYSSYYYPSYYGGYAPYYYPCAGTPAPVVTAQAAPIYQPQYQSQYQPQYQPQAQLPAARPSVPYMPPIPNGNSGNGTYPYDGGPNNPVPLPKETIAPLSAPPQGIIPLDGKLVSLPRGTTGGSSVIMTPDMQRLHFVSTTVPVPSRSSATTSRYTYPAYGEQLIPPAPRR